MIYDTSNLSNFEVRNVKIGEKYQYKEGSIIFNFVLTEFKNDGEYIYLTGELTEKVQKYYGIDRLELTLTVKPYYYSGMVKIMNKDSYWTDVDGNKPEKNNNWPKNK